VKIME